MRLLNVFTGKLEEYFGSAIPKYAILSHTWGLDEITFSDIQNVRDGAPAGGVGLSREGSLSEISIASTAGRNGATPLSGVDEIGKRGGVESPIQSSEPSSPPAQSTAQARQIEMLLTKYRKVKQLYLERTPELERLQKELAQHSWGKNQLTKLRQADPGPILDIEDGISLDQLHLKYRQIKMLYFDIQAQSEYLRKATASWASHQSRENSQIPTKLLNAGYRKILYACKQAIVDGYEYVWIDTCCIDKSSSAELSEAINSMFQWYQKAGVCYAYVEDVKLENFGNSRWFTRGWTLQELLAPSDVIFYGSSWTLLGTRSSLADQITQATGIDKNALLNRNRLKKRSVAQRMSWASKRETTRLEDAAYSLLGIFDVSMPLLYGEGKNAFLRLQEEILKSSVDQSLFAWSIAADSSTSRGSYGIFADSPGDYRDSSSVIPFQRTTDTSPYVMTNKGLQITLPILEGSGNALGLLDCQFHDEIFTYLAISLKRTHTSDIFFRTQGASVGENVIEEDGGLKQKTLGRGGLVVVTHEQALRAKVRQIYIPRDEYEVPSERSSYQIKCAALQEEGFRLVATRPDREMPNVTWNNQAQSLHIVHRPGTSWRSIAFVFHHDRKGAAFAVYMDEYASVDAETPERAEMEVASNVWFSPLVPIPDSDDLPRATYGLKDWWHSLSYGINQHGVAHNRTAVILVKRFAGQMAPSQISASLEAATSFGQTVKVLHIDFHEDVNILYDEDSDASLSGNWESTSRSNWMRDLLNRSAKLHTSSRANYEGSIDVQASVSRTSMEVHVPTAWNRMEEEYSTKEVMPQGNYWKHSLSLPAEPQSRPSSREPGPFSLPWRFSKRSKQEGSTR